MHIRERFRLSRLFTREKIITLLQAVQRLNYLIVALKNYKTAESDNIFCASRGQTLSVVLKQLTVQS